MLLVARLTVRRAHLAAFREFERAAAAAMRRHGGELERAIVLDDPSHTDADVVRELHVVRFPDDAAFAKYRDDPELATLRELRDRSVLATELWRGSDVSY